MKGGGQNSRIAGKLLGDVAWRAARQDELGERRQLGLERVDHLFEPGRVFLPEEIEAGLRVADRELRRAFRTEHGDLLTVRYWEDMQAAHRTGQVPGIRTYPESCYLDAVCPADAADAADE